MRWFKRWGWVIAFILFAVFVVIVTGNHYWLDGLVAMALLFAVVGFERSARFALARRSAATRESPDALPLDDRLSVGSPLRQPAPGAR